jgi:hypothetical protein
MVNLFVIAPSNPTTGWFEVIAIITSSAPVGTIEGPELAVQLAELNQFCQELPTKYGIVLLQWFKQIQDEQNPKEESKKED